MVIEAFARYAVLGQGVPEWATEERRDAARAWLRVRVAYAEAHEGMMTRREVLRLWDADTTAMQELSHVPKIENSYLAGRRDGLRMVFGREKLESLAHELALMNAERSAQDE